MKAVIALSGGMDSATLLGILLHQYEEVHPLIFYYGSKHNKWENRAAENIVDFYQGKGFPVFPHIINLANIMDDFDSDLLITGGAIPEGHYTEDSMQRTVVPGRNTIFISIMLGLAESVGASIIALGAHLGDHHIYPDCRKEYIKAMDTAVYLASNKKVEVNTPLIDDDKTSILQKGYSLNPVVPYELTRTCYKEQRVACGKCGSCRERLGAFENIGREDPIEYE